MSPKLKPLILPRLVQERRKRELESDQSCFVFGIDNTSSSDIASPVTPTFSQRGSHARYSSSSSSLDLGASLCSDSLASPNVLTQAQSHSHSACLSQHPISHASVTSPGNGASASASGISSTVPLATATSPVVSTPNGKKTKRSLPDVQEEELLEKDEAEEGDAVLVELDAYLSEDLYDCLCNEPCVHQRPALIHSATFPRPDLDYDLGFLSDGDSSASPRSSKKRRGRGSSISDSPFAGLTSRFSSRLPNLTRWRSAERQATNLTFTPASEPTLDYHRPSLSIAPSSRSSSVSGRGRRSRTIERSNEPPMPPTPALSFYGSSENVSSSMPAPLGVEAANADAGHSLERQRALATTPLLPPLMTELPPAPSQSVPQSPLEFPKVEPQLANHPQLVCQHSAQTPSQQVPSTGTIDLSSPMFFPSPTLSSKPSVSSFRQTPGTATTTTTASSVSTPPSASTAEIPSPILNLALQDSWSDRLGHANFTILPKPYVPETADLKVLQSLRADWDQARINYMKHLVRTGEHYGTTSNTYSLTEAKWSEIEQEWRTAHDSVVDRFAALCNGNGDPSAALRWRRPQEEVCPSTVPRMLDAEKFPGLGDEDIVGPMARDAVMFRDDCSPTRESGSASKFWRSLADKVRIRRKESLDS